MCCWRHIWAPNYVCLEYFVDGCLFTSCPVFLRKGCGIYLLLNRESIWATPLSSDNHAVRWSPVSLGTPRVHPTCPSWRGNSASFGVITATLLPVATSIFLRLPRACSVGGLPRSGHLVGPRGLLNFAHCPRPCPLHKGYDVQEKGVRTFCLYTRVGCNLCLAGVY